MARNSFDDAILTCCPLSAGDCLLARRPARSRAQGARRPIQGASARRSSDARPCARHALGLGAGGMQGPDHYRPSASSECLCFCTYHGAIRCGQAGSKQGRCHRHQRRAAFGRRRRSRPPCATAETGDSLAGPTCAPSRDPSEGGDRQLYCSGTCSSEWETAVGSRQGSAHGCHDCRCVLMYRY